MCMVYAYAWLCMVVHGCIAWRQLTTIVYHHRGPRRIIGRTPLLGTFDAVVQLPALSAGADGPPGAAVRRLLWLCGAAAEASEELALLSALVPPAMPLKQILHAVELSRLPSAEPEPSSDELRTAEAEGAAEESAAEAAGGAADGAAEAAGAAAAGAAVAEGAARPAGGAQAARAARAAREARAARAVRAAQEAEAAEEALSDALVTAALPYRSRRATPT